MYQIHASTKFVSACAKLKIGKIVKTLEATESCVQQKVTRCGNLADKTLPKPRIFTFEKKSFSDSILGQLPSHAYFIAPV